MSIDNVELTYRLPVTVVTIDGTRTIIDNKYANPAKSMTYTSVIETKIEADSKSLYVLRLPRPDDSVTSGAIEISVDGRLISTQADVDDKSQERVRALLKAGLTAAGVAIPLAVAAIAAPAALPTVGAMVLAGAGMRATGGTTRTLAISSSLDGKNLDDYLEELEGTEFEGSGANRMPTLNALGIEVDYNEADPRAANLLANLRWSDIQLRLATATLGSTYSTDPAALVVHAKALAKGREAIAKDLADAESSYTKWIASAAKSDLDVFHYTFRLEDLPNTRKLREVANARPEGNVPTWWPAVENLQCAVSIDYEDGDIESATNPPPLYDAERHDSEEVVYRVPRIATITHWSAKPNDKVLTSQTEWEMREVLRERHKVVVLRGTECSIALRPKVHRRIGGAKPRGDSDTGITFNADGLLTKVTTKRTDPSLERAATIAELPDALKGGLDAAKATLKPFTVSGETDRLKEETELIKAQKELKKAQAPAPDDPLAELKAEVEKAELEARRSRAEAITSDPTSSLIVLTVSPPADESADEE